MWGIIVLFCEKLERSLREGNFCENNFLKRPKHWLKFSPLLGPEQVSLNRQSVRIQGTTFSGEKLGILQKFPWDGYDALARWTKLLEWLSKGVRRGGENIKQSVLRSQGTPLFFLQGVQFVQDVAKSLPGHGRRWNKLLKRATRWVSRGSRGTRRRRGRSCNHRLSWGHRLQGWLLRHFEYLSICQDDDC